MTTVALMATSLVATGGTSSITITLPPNLAALVALWATVPATMTTFDKLRFVNSQQVPGPPVDVPRMSVKIALDGTQSSVLAYATAGGNLQARIACNYLLTLTEGESSPMIQTSDPVIFALVQKIAPDMLTDPATGITPAMVARLLSMITPPVPWWQMNGFTRPVNVQDLINAGYLY